MPMLSGRAVFVSNLVLPVVTLGGQFINASNSGADAIARVVVDQDGNMYEQINQGSLTQIDTTDDWVRPTSASPGSYENRYTGLTGDALSNAPAAEDTWVTMSGGDRTYDNIDSGPTEPDSLSTTITLQIRLGSGPVLDGGSYILVADREDI